MFEYEAKYLFLLVKDQTMKKHTFTIILSLHLVINNHFNLFSRLKNK